MAVGGAWSHGRLCSEIGQSILQARFTSPDRIYALPKIHTATYAPKVAEDVARLIERHRNVLRVREVDDIIQQHRQRSRKRRRRDRRRRGLIDTIRHRALRRRRRLRVRSA